MVSQNNQWRLYYISFDDKKFAIPEFIGVQFYKLLLWIKKQNNLQFIRLTTCGVAFFSNVDILLKRKLQNAIFKNIIYNKKN